MAFDFTVTDEMLRKVKEWDTCDCRSGSAGDRLEYSFLPTGIGVFASVKCLGCGKTLNLTDYDNL